MKMERRFDHRLWRRQGNAFNGDANTGGANPGSDPDDNVWWGNSDAADAVKWSVVTAIVLLLCLWLIGGYYHARRRLRKGLAPLAYHRFLVARHLPRPEDHYPMYHNGAAGPYYGPQYPMNAYPPPAYHASTAPPAYHGVSEGSKVPSEGQQPSPSEPSTSAPPIHNKPRFGLRNPFRQ